MCTPVGTPRLCKNGLFGRSYEAGWAGPSQAGLAKRSGYREAGVQPRGSSAVPGWQGGVWCCAKTLCPGGRAATQAGLFPCQLLTHPLPGPLSFLSVYRTCSNTAVLLPPPACQNPQPNRWRFWPLSRGTFTARIHQCRKDTSELCVVWILQLQIWFEQLLCVVTFPLRWFSVNSEPPGAEARLKRGGSPSRVKSAPLWRRKASVSEGCSWFCCCVWVYEEGQVYPHRQGGLGLRLNLTLRQLVLTRTVPPMGHLPFIKHTHAHTPSPACSFLTKVPQTPEEERAFLIFEANTRERREAFFSIYFTCVVNRKIGWRQTFEGKSRDHF